MPSAIMAFCSTSNTAVPRELISVMMSKICSTKIGARPMDGSSSSKIFGCAISARPIASICCSPPDIVPAAWLSRSFRRGKRSKTFLKSFCTSGPDLRRKAPISRFSRTDMRANTRRPSGLWPTPRRTISCGAAASIDFPFSVMLPERARSKPEMVRKVVVLPAPLEPISVTISPSSTLRETPRSACTAP